MYDDFYLDSVKDDVRRAIDENYCISDYEDRDEFEQVLNDELWIDDSVTGNASGSYTFDRMRAAEYVFSFGEDHCREMIDEWGIDAETVADHLFDWEYWDVSIRCYLLGRAISEVLDEIQEEEEYDDEEEAEEDNDDIERFGA